MSAPGFAPYISGASTTYRKAGAQLDYAGLIRPITLCADRPRLADQLQVSFSNMVSQNTRTQEI